MLPDSRTDASRTVDDRMALAREWDRLVGEVRELDGFAGFLRPPRLSDLLPAAAEGPVAMLNVSHRRCDAVLVRAAGVEVLPLPRVTSASVTAMANDYLAVLDCVEQAARHLLLARRRFDDGDHGLAATRACTTAQRALLAAERARDLTLRGILSRLWEEIAGPVLTALGLLGPPPPGRPWPRMWWCPTGPLALLPVHAAGHHDGEPGRSVLDRVVSSYTPTLGALVRARRPPAPAPADERMLIVAQPDAPGEAPLPDVTRERDLLRSLFPDRHTLLEGAAASAEPVREQLRRHRWAHFSCHGDQDLADPSRGGLLLHDGVLSIADIGARQHDGEFAFLSACKTAVGGAHLADEAITLAAALHFTGYRRVIGTLWSVQDRTAADVATAVYADLTSTGRFQPTRAAHALHSAVRRLRDEARPLHAWTPFTHTGS